MNRSGEDRTESPLDATAELGLARKERGIFHMNLEPDFIAKLEVLLDVVEEFGPCRRVEQEIIEPLGHVGHASLESLLGNGLEVIPRVRASLKKPARLYAQRGLNGELLL